MNHKKHLVSLVADTQGLTKKQAANNVDAVLEAISQLAFKSGGLTLRGFGKFTAKLRAGRVLTVGRADKSMTIARHVLTFRAGSRQRRPVIGE